MTTDMVRKGHVGQSGNPGQFAQKAHAEADEGVDFTFDIEVHNSAGSWSFPPRPMTAEQHIAFWERADPPDRALEQVQLEHERMANDTKEEVETPVRDAFYAKWDEEHRRELPYSLQWDPYGPASSSKDEAKRTEWLERRKAAWEAEYERLGGHREAEFYPDRIHAYDVRDVARAGRMYTGAEALPVEEREKVLNHYMPSLGTTVAGVWEKYRCDKWFPLDDGFTKVDGTPLR